jgi:hypothetical protein
LNVKSQRDVEVGGGFLLILFALSLALGSVSLGYYDIVTQGGVTHSPYLVTNYYLVALAIGLAALGIFFAYDSGKAHGRNLAGRSSY